MKKNKFYVLLSILTVIFLFSFSAICNQCAATTEEEKTDVEEEATEEEATSEKEVTEEEETTEEGTEEEEVAEGDREVPTIELEIYEGPTLYEGICYWRVQANVTGKPSPTVEFSKDDSGGAWGTKKAQVNLYDPSDTYTLNATATNSEGTATDSIELSWECDVLEVADGDGDGDGDEPEPEPDEVSFAAVENISGYIWEDGSTYPDSQVRMGDTNEDSYVRGYLSFDIRELHGKTVQEADINFTSIRYHGDPSSFASEIVVKVFNYVRLDAWDLRIGGTPLVSIPLSDTSATITGTTLRNELQDVLDNEVRDYFQIKLGLDGETDNDGFPDCSYIYCDDAILHIVYTD